jgi:PKD domain
MYLLSDFALLSFPIKVLFDKYVWRKKHYWEKKIYIPTSVFVIGFIVAVPIIDSYRVHIILDQPTIDGLKITINGKAISQVGGTITRTGFHWDDGNANNGTFPMSHTYRKPGAYSIRITADDSKGQNNTSSLIVCVSNTPRLTCSD